MLQTQITKWAKTHGISSKALVELLLILDVFGAFTKADELDNPLPDAAPPDESAVSKLYRLHASKQGTLLWRNNVGAGKLSNGRFIRWGLANETSKMNELLKSSDFIGINKHGKLVAAEIKEPGWKYTGRGRERAQLNFLKLVAKNGGVARFVTMKDNKLVEHGVDK